MDTLLVLGDLDDKLNPFFKKVGYRTIYYNLLKNEATLPDLIGKEMIDLVIINDCKDKQAHELVTFIRHLDNTKDTPLLILSPDKLQTLQIKELNFDKIEIVQPPFSLGTIVSKVATSLRLRKMNGLNSDKATLAETNIALRDLNERYQKELLEARAIQDSLLPKFLPQGDSFEVATKYEPLEEVGGDFYTVDCNHDGLIRLLSADVTGHGLPAAFIGSMTKLALVASEQATPGDLLQKMNALLSSVIPAGRFVTANSFLFNPLDGKLLYSRAGAPPALVFSSDRNQKTEVLGDGYPLGFFEDSKYTTGELEIERNGVLVVVTDGITEGQNRNQKMFGLEGVVNAVKKTNPSDSAQVILDKILNDFYQFLDGRILKDDVTVLVLVRR